MEVALANRFRPLVLCLENTLWSPESYSSFGVWLCIDLLVFDEGRAFNGVVAAGARQKSGRAALSGRLSNRPALPEVFKAATEKATAEGDDGV